MSCKINHTKFLIFGSAQTMKSPKCCAKLTRRLVYEHWLWIYTLFKEKVGSPFSSSPMQALGLSPSFNNCVMVPARTWSTWKIYHRVMYIKDTTSFTIKILQTMCHQLPKKKKKLTFARLFEILLFYKSLFQYIFLTEFKLYSIFKHSYRILVSHILFK